MTEEWLSDCMTHNSVGRITGAKGQDSDRWQRPVPGLFQGSKLLLQLVQHRQDPADGSIPPHHQHAQACAQPGQCCEALVLTMYWQGR